MNFQDEREHERLLFSLMRGVLTQLTRIADAMATANPDAGQIASLTGTLAADTTKLDAAIHHQPKETP
jgi:hypothetical protein